MPHAPARWRRSGRLEVRIGCAASTVIAGPDESPGQSIAGTIRRRRQFNDEPPARGLAGVNSYEKELGLNPIHVLTSCVQTSGGAAWLDLCCGQGKAIIEAGTVFSKRGCLDNVALDGVDLVDAFDPIPTDMTNVRLICASLHSWQPSQSYDLITCVHGLHYIGDKLNLIERAVRWLSPNGTFICHVDLANLRRSDGASLNRRILSDFRKLGLLYNRRPRFLSCPGRKEISFGLRFVGADENAGPNFTRQDAVDSYYEIA